MKFAQQLIQHELNDFEKYFTQALKGQSGLLNKIMHYIVKRKGKQMRPMFVLLAARLGGPINESTFRAASLVELLHTATLVHDDVVDESMQRRGFFSINYLWKNKIAVLVGDYLLSRGLLLSLDHGDFGMLKELSTAVKEMSEGELLQMEKSRTLNLNEEIYYQIIKGKTASLLASSCAAGAISTFGEKSPQVELLRKFGECTGMAFQIKDDLFDYGNADVGKPTGNDIREKKATLPLIYALNNTKPAHKAAIIKVVRSEKKSADDIQYVVGEVKALGGIAYATQKMNAYRDEALALLAQFPSSDTRTALEELVRYTTDRKY